MLYLYDFDSDGVLIPEYMPDEAVSVTETALSIAVQSEDDGYVELVLCSPSSSFDSALLKELFRGKISSPSGYLTLCSMGEQRIGSIRSKAGECGVKVFADTQHFPTKVVILVEQP